MSVRAAEVGTSVIITKLLRQANNERLCMGRFPSKCSVISSPMDDLPNPHTHYGFTFSPRGQNEVFGSFGIELAENLLQGHFTHRQFGVITEPLQSTSAFPATYRYPYGCDRKAGLDERFGLSAPVEPLSLFSR
jgi:hypothetical protein